VVSETIVISRGVFKRMTSTISLLWKRTRTEQICFIFH